MKCRHCRSSVVEPFVDLGTSPPSNAYLSLDALSLPETHYPLRVLVCTKCWLVQTQDFARADDLFGIDYAYFSSVSHSWLRHAAQYVESIIERLCLDHESFVIEVAANDGYLLKNFVKAGIPCLGIEPTASTANAAEVLGIPIIREFFGAGLSEALASDGKCADLIVANNVFAHVPDINDFSRGLKRILKADGVITLEFPHLLKLIEQCQFDTVYHEHFSYLSLHAVDHVFQSVGLRIWNVEEIPTHGGSLRIYGCHAQSMRSSSESVMSVMEAEVRGGLLDVRVYSTFQQRSEAIKYDFIEFLIDLKRSGRSVAGYGAAAKGNTLMNFAGVRSDLIPYVCDAGISKQSKFMPGSRIPIVHPRMLLEKRPDYVVIFPWNIAEEVVALHGYIRDWGGKFVTAVPHIRQF